MVAFKKGILFLLSLGIKGMEFHRCHAAAQVINLTPELEGTVDQSGTPGFRFNR